MSNSKKVPRKKARIPDPIFYSQIVDHFPDLPPIGEWWLAHPFCGMFEELDQEDFDNKLPFRTALVVSKEANRPGQGFFNTYKRMHNRRFKKADQDKIWNDELNKLKAHYK